MNIINRTNNPAIAADITAVTVNVYKAKDLLGGLIVGCIGVGCIGVGCIGVGCIGVGCIGEGCIGVGCIGEGDGRRGHLFLHSDRLDMVLV